jgi:transcriptional regulator with XRE-family HTH domain
VQASTTLRTARRRAGLTLRALAELADTSHTALAAYEAGRKEPAVATFDRILRAAGFEADLRLTPALGGPPRADRGRELEEVLHLAEQFPARHADRLLFPVFAQP